MLHAARQLWSWLIFDVGQEMIRYAHIALLIPLSEPSGKDVSEHLGVVPTNVRESKGYRGGSDGVLEPHVSHTWMLDSRLDAAHQPIARIHALLDSIEAFADRLLSLDSKYQRWIDILFHVTPQHSHGITGEFDWLSLPHDTMGRLSRLQLDLSYEVFWFDHPDWQIPWHQKLLRKLRRQEPNKAPEPTPTAVTSRAVGVFDCTIVRKARLDPAAVVAHL